LDGIAKETNLAISRMAWQRPQVSLAKMWLVEIDFSCATAASNILEGEAAGGSG
jgi:hypothetical protein